ncbi:DUF559 domain-containing protein [Paenibacillus allorhizosphaerae]|uniref:DUF559 domain-containing protein n=1 Tax=Paenibacillus allorhizosphaerae TaxID=2849866 RepID=A0ABM8VKY9_9BACL|nr:DUF559 domain-containing protein [Paenibacillus allorhizosphaerae]CAG7647697.1 hypothetical protein PAECIP111802_04042 [Paenibacillus allorhizosphaerae]
MHTNLKRFIGNFEREAQQNGSFRNQLGRAELVFLQEVWGPAFQHNYDGLKAEYPFKDFKGGIRFADFVFVKNGMRLIIEIDGFTTHARDISSGEFDDHLMRQNDLILYGWLLLRFSARQVEKRPQLCQRQIMQAIGHWWTIDHGALTVHAADIWLQRKKLVIQMANRRNGKIKPGEVAVEFGICNSTAAEWMKRFVKEGSFFIPPYHKRATVYHLREAGDC